MVGISPPDNATVNILIGQSMRDFVKIREEIARFQTWLTLTDLKLAPFSFTAADEATIKSAIGNLNTSLQALDMTFINRLTGLG